MFICFYTTQNDLIHYIFTLKCILILYSYIYYTAPSIVDRYSGPKVIMTEWMEGTRLDIDASPDVPRLCGVAINAYLTMLLDTGVLHCE